MTSIPMSAIQALKLRNYLKKHPIEPLKVFESDKFQNGLWVYTFQCGFKTEEELKQFKVFNKLISSGIDDNTK